MEFDEDFHWLLKGYGLYVSQDPGYALPDGIVAPIDKSVPARKNLNHSVEYSCTNLYLHSFALSLKPIDSYSFNFKDVNNLFASKTHRNHNCCNHQQKLVKSVWDKTSSVETRFALLVGIHLYQC